MDNLNNSRGKGIIAKLSAFEEGKMERPIYRNQAHTSEKSKGIMMIEYLKGLFGINGNDVNSYIRRELKEQQKIKWPRDAKGNIVSKWSKKAVKSDEAVDNS